MSLSTKTIGALADAVNALLAAALLFLVGVLIGTACVGSTGCTPSPAVVESLENAAAVAQYKALLAECRELGKDAGSYVEYALCADAVDRQLCGRSALRCADGGAP